MNIDRHLNLWEQAQAAHSCANWSLLLQCLGQLVEESKRRKGEEAEEIHNVHSQVQVSSAPCQSPATIEEQSESMLGWAMDILEYGDFAQRWDIAKLFPKLGSSAIAPIIEVVQDEEADEELHWFSVRILGKFDHPDAINVLISLLKSSDQEEKAQAAASLSEIGTSAVAAITELLAQEDTRLLAVRSLSYIRNSETITPLLSVVQDPQIEIRTAAIEALSSFHDPRIVPVLLNALNDIAASVRREAVIGLSFRTDLREELDLVNRLLPLLHDFNLSVCQATAKSLGRIGTDAAADGLFKVLQSPHTPLTLQIEIVRALGKIETQTSLEYLRSSVLAQTNSAVWQEIVEVLGQIEPASLKPLAAQILIELLQSNQPAIASSTIKQAIAHSLGQLGDLQAIDPLIHLLAPDAAVRLHAIAALKQLNYEEAYHKLEQMSRDNSLATELQQGIAIALQEWSIGNR